MSPKTPTETNPKTLDQAETNSYARAEFRYMQYEKQSADTNLCEGACPFVFVAV